MATARSSIEGRRILVTGASSGVGRAAAAGFAADGARVALVARRGEIIEELAAELGDDAFAFPADVSDPDSVARAVAGADAALGGLDVAVNSAGVGFPTKLEDIDPGVWRQVLDINLSGTFYIAREAGLRMRDAGGGVIVNVGSDLSHAGMGLFVHYCASKFGVVGLTKALAAELAPKVRVNAVCPGPINTPMMEAEIEWFPDPAEARVQATERVPLGRFADPEEVAAAIRFLAFEAPFATGAVLPLDGGSTIV